MVPVDPRGGSPAQGPAVLPSVRGERGDRIHRLCFRAEPAARYVGRAGASSPGRRGIRAGREGQLPPPQFTAELTYGRDASCPAARACADVSTAARVRWDRSRSRPRLFLFLLL